MLVHEEVESALSEGRPVVALESTIVSHGLPRPDNLRIARELEAVYVWGAQTGGARRLGVPEATITAIRENHSRGIPPEDAEIVDFTRQLLRRHRVDAASASSLHKRFGNDGFIQLTGAIGYYAMLAMTVNACELEAAPDAEVLKV